MPNTGEVQEDDLTPTADSSEFAKKISSSSLGGSATGSVQAPADKCSAQKGNHRRPSTDGQATRRRRRLEWTLRDRARIGGGGMGAVYLAKDRNLGDAPRAVKEMVEAHLDPAQHEKAIGDFQTRVVAADFAGASFDPDHLRLFLRRTARVASIW